MVEVSKPRHWVYHQLMQRYSLFRSHNHRWDGFYHLSIWLDLFFNPTNRVLWSENGNPLVRSLEDFDQQSYQLHRNTHRYWDGNNSIWNWSSNYDSNPAPNGMRRNWLSPTTPFSPDIPLMELHYLRVNEPNGWANDQGIYGTPCLDNALSAEYLARLAWVLKTLPVISKDGNEKFREWWYDGNSIVTMQGFANYQTWFSALKAYCAFVSKKIFGTENPIDFSRKVEKCQELLDSRKELCEQEA